LGKRCRNFISRYFSTRDLIDRMTDIKGIITTGPEVIWIDKRIRSDKFATVIVQFSAFLHP
jgi:hypothetical protein